MIERTNFMKNGVRALTGVVITVAAAVGALLLGTIAFPTIESEPRATQVDTMQTGARSIVCAGAFSELGADPSRPDIAVPIGEASVLVSGPGELGSLTASESDETSVGGSAVITGTMSEPLAAAQVQRLTSETLTGSVASSCVEPVNEQWLLGGASTLGYSSTLSIGNPGSVAATVHVSVFDENGEIDGQQTTGVIVAPNSEQVISLNGYAPSSERFAVRTSSTGAPITASLSIAEVDGILPVGAATVTSQVRADTHLVIPAIANEATGNHEPAPNVDGTGDQFPVRVQAIAAGDTAGSAQVYAVDADGARSDLGSLELTPGVLSELEVQSWPKDGTAIVIDADVPVYAAAGGAVNTDGERDFEWFIPAPSIEADTETMAAIVGGGTLFIANTGSEDASVTVSEVNSDGELADSDAKPVTVEVPAGSAVPVKATQRVMIESTSAVHAAVRILTPGGLAGYPIVPSSEPASELTVYTR
ncbi:MAG: DUF5719 family protein [Leucobacter sp.]